MDPGFFADLDPGFRSPDPVLIRFWRSLTKKNIVKSAKYDIYHFFLL